MGKTNEGLYTLESALASYIYNTKSIKHTKYLLSVFHKALPRFRHWK